MNLLKSTTREKALFNIIGFLLIIGYILPTSLEELTMYPEMRYRNFFFLDIVAVLIIFYEKSFDKRRIICSILILVILFFFTIIAKQTYMSYTPTTGNLLLYGTMIICCNVTFRKIKATELWDKMFLAMMIIILVFAFGTILINDTLNTILRTYYVDLLNFFLDNMLIQLKPVTFFVSHSIAAFNYALFIVVLFLRDKCYKRQIINKILIVGFLVCMAFLRSNSGILLCFILFGIYTISVLKHHAKFSTVSFLIALSIILLYVVSTNLDIIETILSSNDNGLKGRFSDEGALSNSIKFIEDLNLPTGLIDIKYNGQWLLYRDSSYLVNMMRGGIFLVFIYTCVFIIFIKKNIRNIAICKLFILLVLLFDLGYPVTWEQRFLSGLLFLLPYVNFITCKKVERYGKR